MTWMVTGGAGYIGSHVARRMQSAGIRTVILDDLSSGKREFVPADTPLVEASLLDEVAVEEPAAAVLRRLSAPSGEPSAAPHPASITLVAVNRTIRVPVMAYPLPRAHPSSASCRR